MRPAVFELLLKQKSFRASSNVRFIGQSFYYNMTQRREKHFRKNPK